MAVVTPEIEEQIRRYYVPGVFGIKNVARRVGVSDTTVRRVLNPEYAARLRRLSREAKRRRRGTCEVCGGETRYGGGPRPMGRICASCHALANAERGRSLRGTGPCSAAALTLLSLRPYRAAELAEALSISRGFAYVLLHRLVSYGLAERVSRGLYRKVS